MSEEGEIKKIRKGKIVDTTTTPPGQTEQQQPPQVPIEPKPQHIPATMV